MPCGTHCRRIMVQQSKIGKKKQVKKTDLVGSSVMVMDGGAAGCCCPSNDAWEDFGLLLNLGTDDRHMIHLLLRLLLLLPLVLIATFVPHATIDFLPILLPYVLLSQYFALWSSHSYQINVSAAVLRVLPSFLFSGIAGVLVLLLWKNTKAGSSPFSLCFCLH